MLLSMQSYITESFPLQKRLETIDRDSDAGRVFEGAVHGPWGYLPFVKHHRTLADAQAAHPPHTNESNTAHTHIRTRTQAHTELAKRVPQRCVSANPSTIHATAPIHELSHLPRAPSSWPHRLDSTALVSSPYRQPREPYNLACPDRADTIIL